MPVSRRAFVIGAAALAVCRRKDELADVVARAKPDELRQRLTGLDVDRALAAAWLAPILWGGLPSDVHAILVLPAIRELRAPAAVTWAVVNASFWCQAERTRAPNVATRPSEAALCEAVQRGDDSTARSHAAGLPFDAALRVLCVEAIEPRDDPHTTIYAAQLHRAASVWPELRRAEVIAHLAQYLSRRPRLPARDVVVQTSPAALVARVAAISDPHATTHSDALVELLLRFASLSELDRCLHPRTLDANGPPPLVEPTLAELSSGTSDDLHAYKRWAATRALRRNLGFD